MAGREMVFVRRPCEGQTGANISYLDAGFSSSGDLCSTGAICQIFLFDSQEFLTS